MGVVKVVSHNSRISEFRIGIQLGVPLSLTVPHSFRVLSEMSGGISSTYAAARGNSRHRTPLISQTARNEWGTVAFPNPLTCPGFSRYHHSSLLYGADLGFHAEWLRDEPYEATTTGSEFIFWSPGVNSRPTQGEHEIRGAEFLASRSSFPLSRERGFRVSGHFPDGSSRRLLRSEWLK